MATLIILEASLALVIYFVARWLGLRPRAIQIPLVAASAAAPVFDATLDQIFWIEPGARPIHPTWVVGALGGSFYASIVISLAVIVLAKGYRIPAAVFALPQIPLTWLVGFLAVMGVTGNWI